MNAKKASRGRRTPLWWRALLWMLLLLVALVAAWVVGGPKPSSPAMAQAPLRANVAPAGGAPFAPYVRHGDLPNRAPLAQTLRLLRDSHDRTTPVRILFYGQSITEQGWWKRVVDDLHAAYPRAELQVENRAIGGHDSTMLRKTAEADVFPFQPDLVIFHVYGSHRDYEALIRSIREQTTADVMAATDHVNDEAQRDEETNPLRLELRAWLYRLPHLVSERTRDGNWTAWMNYRFLPAMAQRQGVQLVDVRDQWKAYLTENHLHASDLLRDQVHLNDHGQYVMAAIVAKYLAPLPAVAEPGVDDRIVQVAPLPAPAGANQPVRIVFRGTRVDALPLGSPAIGSPASGLPVLVDGRPPCSLPGSHRFDRVTAYPGSNWPTLLRVQPGGTPLQDETWTLTLLQMDEALKHVRFSVSGSKTGPDGSGDSKSRFVSHSGRLLIEPGDWDLASGRAAVGRPVPAGFQIVWHSACHGTDLLAASAPPPPVPFTLVQGIANVEHVLLLPAGAAESLRAIRVYRPPEGRR